MKQKLSKISVIMPVYNTEKYVGEAIESILSQSFTDFEFLIIDDCSSDGSYEVCKEYAKKDKRIQLYKNEKNIGVVKTRNKLLSYVASSSKYIALLDADDIACKTRLQIQYAFLQKHPDISIVGSNINIINQEAHIIGKRNYPQSFSQIQKSIFKKSPLAQPAAMIRKTDLDTLGVYNEDFERCQDYELWCRFFDGGYKIENLQEFLTKYRVFSEQGKSKHLKLTLKNTLKIQRKYIFQRKYFSVSNVGYFFVGNILLFFPKNFILWLFKKLEYKKIDFFR